MRIVGERLVVEGKTEALAVVSVLGELDQLGNRGKLRQDWRRYFVSLALQFEPPLPIERLSVARLTGRRILDRVRRSEPQEEYVLDGSDKIQHFGEALALGVMPMSILSSGPRLGKKRYLRDNRVKSLYEYLRGEEVVQGTRGTT